MTGIAIDHPHPIRPTPQLLGRLAALCATGALLAAPSAVAQNLVKDPYFANGAPASGTTDSFGNGYYTNAASAATFGGLTGLRLGAGNGYLEVYPIAGYDPNGVNYVLTFLAASVNPQQPATAEAQLYHTTGDGGYSLLDQIITGTGLTQVTLSATSSAQYGTIGFFSVGSVGSGDLFVTGLDLEPAPLPAAGGGALSFAALLAGLGVDRLRRRAHGRTGRPARLPIGL